LTRNPRSDKVLNMNADDFYSGSPSFDMAVRSFLTHAQQVVGNGFPSPPRLETTTGPKYIRVIRQPAFSGIGRSVYCFIGRADGNIWLAKSWKAPALNTPRGNIYRSETFTCAGPYGVAYLR
jgi:hypothetical protein